MSNEANRNAPDGGLAEIFGRVIEAVVRDPSVSFRRLAETAGLDPSTDFIGASLIDVDFRDEDLRGFNFAKSDLTGADFRRANVEGVSFDGAVLTGVIGLSVARPAFRIEKQLQSNWAWCAVAVSVAKYYDPTTALTQCELANLVLGRGDCCRSGASVECDRPARLSDALRATGHLISWSTGRLPADKILSRISNYEVIPCLIRFTAHRISHALVIIGAWSVEHKLYIAIADPAEEGVITMAYDSPHYRSVPIRWESTYRVR